MSDLLYPVPAWYFDMILDRLQETDLIPVNHTFSTSTTQGFYQPSVSVILREVPHFPKSRRPVVCQLSGLFTSEIPHPWFLGYFTILTLPLVANVKFQVNFQILNIIQFPLAPMGVLAPGSAHARPFAQPPIDTSGNLSAHVSGMGCKKNDRWF